MKLGLKVSNFQSIKQAELNLGGFTMITGASNLGKSAIRRAFATALYNDWSPSYIRHGNKETSITLTRDDNTIQIEKGSKNTFVVNGTAYNKIGTAVPEEYEKLGWLPLETQGETYRLNIATQLEPLFMIGTTDSENTRILNSALKVDIFEEAARLSNTDARSYETSAKEVKKDLENLNSEIKEIDTKLKDLESIKNKLEVLEKHYRLIQQYIDAALAYNVDKPRYTTLVAKADAIRKVELIMLADAYTNKRRQYEKHLSNQDVCVKLLELLLDLSSIHTLVGEKASLEALRTGTTTLERLDDLMYRASLAKRCLEKTEEAERRERQSERERELKLKIDGVESIFLLVKAFGKRNIAKRKAAILEDAVGATSDVEMVYDYLLTAESKAKLESNLSKSQQKLQDIEDEIHSYGVCPLCQQELHQ